MHRLRERHTFRKAADPESVWRCCEHWQRTLVNKWNGREFARKHGARLPELYWRGRRIRKIPFESLPPRFVIRPVWGTLRRGVHVVADGRELLRDEPAAPSELKGRLLRERGPLRVSPILVEQFVATETGEYRLPVEYKCHTFGDTVAAVQVIERTGPLTGTHRYYTPAWEPFADLMNTAKPLAALREAPPCLREMLLLAVRLGRAVGTYMRIDFFSTDRGCVFNEFSSTPQVGNLTNTPFCDDLFGALWREKFPDAS
ncbi:MAG: ATP-grasp fold amidoligase family protein [Planctomycetota bacterium]